MTTHDEHDNDGNLKPYLEGRDGVSATYRKLTGEQPPAELDALILQAAAGAVAKPAPRLGAGPRHYYAMAASLCLGVLLSSLYYEQQVPDTGPLIVTASVDQRQVRELDAGTPAAADTSIEEVVVQGSRIRLAEAQRDVAEAGPAQGNTERALAVAADEVAKAENFLAPAAPAPTGIVPQGAQPDRQVAVQRLQPAPAQRASEPDNEPAEAVQDETGQSLAQLMEQVASARVTTSAQNEPPIIQELASADALPRTSIQLQTQALWLEEIVRLAREMDALVSTTEALRQRLEAEQASFRATYPDFDLDAALAE